MPHPFHVHGAGRFLVLSKDGVTESNLAWKDTVLLLAGQTVDILLEVTNPGLWMAHCHIAEHNQSGMMFSFDVAPRGRVVGGPSVDRDQPGGGVSDRTPRGRVRRSRRVHGTHRSARRRRRCRRRAQVLRPHRRAAQGRCADREDHRRRGDGRHLRRIRRARDGARPPPRSSRNHSSPVCGSECTTGQSWNEAATSSEQR